MGGLHSTWAALAGLLLAVAGCAAPSPAGKAAGSSSPDRPGPWDRVGKVFGRDLAMNFKSDPLLVLRPLEWEGASSLERAIRTRALARAIRESTGWPVLTGKGPLRGERAVLEVRGRVFREESLPGGPAEEVVEFTVRLEGSHSGAAPPWTAAYPLIQETCRGST